MDQLDDGQLTVSITENGRIAVTGALDLACAGQLYSTVERLRAEADRPVVIDLSGVTFCDSTGLSSLIWAHHQNAVLANPSRRLDRLLAITGLDEHLPMQTIVD